MTKEGVALLFASVVQTFTKSLFWDASTCALMCEPTAISHTHEHASNFFSLSLRSNSSFLLPTIFFLLHPSLRAMTHHQNNRSHVMASHFDLFPGIDFSFRVPFPIEVVTEEPFPHNHSSNLRRSKSASAMPTHTCRRSKCISTGSHRRVAVSLPSKSTRRPSPLSQSRSHAAELRNASSAKPHGAAVEKATPPTPHHAPIQEHREQEEDELSIVGEDALEFTLENFDNDETDDDGFVEGHLLGTQQNEQDECEAGQD